MAENGGFLGVSDPLSTAPPDAKDLALNDQLVAELKAQNNFEHPDDTAKRNAVLTRLSKLLKELVQKVGRQKAINPEILKDAGGKVFTYGSYRLGVYGPGSDIDTLMVAPKHVKRDDFFAHMPDMLRKSAAPGELTELVPVPGISVPIIKLELCGISIDLIFCSLPGRDSVPTSLVLTDNELLRGLDDSDLRCVNGTRVTDRILSLVPQARVFRIALRAVKLWAQRRAIYGNVVGYPGGVAYAMMVARICQLYPAAAAPTIVTKFFWIIRTWKWPSPIYLQAREQGPLGKPEWDPSVNRYDKLHLMPVITPAYPCMNSTHTITPSTKLIMLRELDRGAQIMQDINKGRKQWKDLFAKQTFFTDSYQHYICVITAGRTKEAQQAWSGLVQSRVRRLLQGIEGSDADSVKLVQPFNKGIDRHHLCKSDGEVDKTLAGSLECQVGESKTTEESADVKVHAAAQGANDASVIESAVPSDAAEYKQDSTQELWTTTYYLGIELKKGAKNLDISWPIQDFRRQVLEWQDYNANLHSIQIKHVRDYSLPDDLFAEGEKRPVKKKKGKKEGTPVDSAEKKRSFADAGLDENESSAKHRSSDPGTSTRSNGVATPNGSAG